MAQKILVALDSSERSFEVVKYLGNIRLFRDFSPVLFTVYEGMPSAYRDLAKDPQFRNAARTVIMWESQQREKAERHMEKALKFLGDAGFPMEKISVKVQKKEKGIARDIIREAKTGGYGGAMIGRKGDNKLQSVLFGSTAIKLMDNIREIPLVVAGRDIPVSGKVLVAIDESPCAMKSIAFLSEMIGGKDIGVHMTHVIRGRQEDIPDDIRDILLSEDNVRHAESAIIDIIRKAENRLSEAGVPKDMISSKIITGKRSRARNILREADENGIGTIFIGRSGQASMESLFLGKVSSKVVQAGRTHAVWLIS